MTDPGFATVTRPTLVEASAGTGKTYTITTYFARGIIERGYEPKQILVVTYTKAATSDLRRRARERIADALRRLQGLGEKPDLLDDVLDRAVALDGRVEVERRLKNALSSMDQASIFTIHGFCQHLLQDHPLSFGIDLDLEVDEDLAKMHTELATDFWAAELYDEPEWLVHALAARQVKIQSLATLAEKASMPGVEVIGPDRVERDPGLMKRANAIWREAARTWSTHRDEVLGILADDESLHRSHYPKKSMAAWGERLDRLFRNESWTGLPEPLPKLARGGMKLRKGGKEPTHPFFDICRDLVEEDAALQPIIEFAVYDFQLRFLDYVAAASERRRREAGVLSFDDLLITVHKRLTNDPVLARRIAEEYPLALIDEFQDTDPTQYEIFRAVYGDRSCIYVGDPKQAIYSFRGADVFSYVRAASEVEQRLTLDVNRRSDPSMVEAVNRLFGRCEHPFAIEGIRFESARAHEPSDRSTLQPALDLVFIEESRLIGDQSVAEITANEVARLLTSEERIDDKQVHPGDIAILCRSNAKALAVTKALRNLSIPASLDGDSSVLATDVAKSMRAVLEAALMPGNSRAIRRALLTPLLGVSPLELTEMGDESWTLWVTRFQEWHEIWRRQGVVRFIEEMLRRTGAETRLAATPSARRQLTDLRHVEELLMRGERERQRDPVALMQWYRRLDEGSPDEGMVRAEDLQQRPDADSGAVRVTTIHKSKGLEYGVVFCPFTWKDAELFKDERNMLKFHDADGQIRIDLGSDAKEEHEDAARLEKRSEALRVLYVAVTRAKHRCTLFWGKGPAWYRSALALLLHGQDPSKELSEEELLEDVRALAEASGGVIGCRAPIADLSGRIVGPTSTEALTRRTAARSYDLAPRISSFSALTGHDEKTPGPHASSNSDQPMPPLLTDLPGGTRTGLLVHSILERVSFGSVGSEDAKRTIETELGAYGFARALAPTIQQDLETVVRTPLWAHANSPKLEKLPVDRQLRELEFTLAVERPALGALADLLMKHGAPTAAPRYGTRLRELQSQSLQKFLRGYIDLVFEWEGRWYVADYKSNSLTDYSSGEVSEAVQRHHYVLQGLLYSAAAQRYLRQRLPDFDPNTHWGGACFLFVRGMRGPEAPGSGVFFDPHSPALLEALETWLGGGDERR